MGEVKSKVKRNSVILQVWENEAIKDGEALKILNFTLSRVYFHKRNKKWEYSNSFRQSDLRDVVELIEEYFKGANDIVDNTT